MRRASALLRYAVVSQLQVGLEIVHSPTLNHTLNQLHQSVKYSPAAPVKSIFSRTRNFSSEPQPPTDQPPAAIVEIQDVQTFNSIVALSNKQPVILDAYATWCGPCKQLDPLLKQLISSHKNVLLAKMDIDSINLAQLAQSLRITSVPTLFMLFGGRVIDVKQGVPPKQELEAWIADAARTAAEMQMHVQKSTAEKGNMSLDPTAVLSEAFYALRLPDASTKEIAPFFGRVMEASMANSAEKAAAMAGLAMCAVLDDQLETAQELIENAKALLANNDNNSGSNSAGDNGSSQSYSTATHELGAAQACIDIAKAARSAMAVDARTVDELQAALNSGSDNGKEHLLNTIYTMSLRLFMEKRHQEAMHSALLLVRKDREWKEQAGKRLVLLFCDALDQESEIAKAGRKRLSNIWFI